MPLSLFGIPAVRVAIPPELASEAALLIHLGVSIKEMEKIGRFCERMYRRFEIAKGKGKSRIIHAPDERLKYLQRQIAPLLDRLYSVRTPVHGFVAERSVKTNALAHEGKHFALNIDLKDFFPSITKNRITGVLKSLGIDSRVASIIAQLCCHNAHLPQGAPTSPVLSNMICFRLDKELLAFAKASRCTYTRYADDITLSSRQPMTALFEAVPPSGHFAPNLLAPAFRSIVVSNGFAINPDKAHYADRHSRQTVTGIKINESLNVDRRYVRNIRAALYSVETLGKEAAQEKFEKTYGGTSDLGEHLRGKITWLRHIREQNNPVCRSIADRFNTIFPERNIKTEPTASAIRDKAVWVVEHYESLENLMQGSAFFLRNVGLVTAAHCVEGVEEVEVYHPSNVAQKFKAKVLKRDKDRDLAILEHAISVPQYLELEKSSRSLENKEKEAVVAAGCPSFGPGDRLNVREGNVCSLTVKNRVKMVEVTQKLSPGMSGGPLLDRDNKVVGIIHKGGSGEDRDFATHIEMLNDWLD